MPRTKPSKPSHDLQALLSRTEVVETEVGMMRFYISDSQRCDESLDQDTQGDSALSLMLSGLQRGDTVYDVGCRSGLHSLAFAKAVGPKGMVMCFEHDIFQLFLAHINLTDHGLDACAHFLPIVASDQFGLRRYNRFDLNNNDLDPRNGIDDLSGSGQCIAMPLDQLGDQRSPQLIRIGPMGLELAALKGMQRLIEDAQPRLFVSPESPNSHDEIALYLSQIGYDVYGFSPRFKSKSRAKAAPDGQQLDPQDFNLYCVLPRLHRAPPRLPLLMRAQAMNFRSQLVVAEDRESSRPYFEIEVEADNAKGVANAHFAYWAWQSLRNELRNFVRTFLQSALGQLSPETYGELTRQAVEFISCETPAREYESLRSLLFQANKSIRRAVDEGRKQSEELVALEEKLLIQAGELSKFSYQLTQASIAKSNSDIEIESVQKEKEGLYAQTIQLQQSVSELTSQLLLAKETEAKSHEILATTNARGAAELMSVSKAHKQEIGHLESKIASLEGENASLTSRAEQLAATVAAAMDAKEQEALAALALANEQATAMDAKEQEALAALALANEQASQIKQLTASVAGAMDAKEQEALAALALANEQASQIKQLTASVAAAMDAKEQVALAALALANEQASQIKQLTASVAAAMDAKEQEALAALALANEQASQIEQLTAGVAGAMDAKEQEALAALALANEQASQIEQLELQLIEAQEHGTLALRAREALEETLRQKEGEFEDAKAGFEIEVKKLLQDQSEIILRGRAAEDKITNLNQALDAEIQEKASIQSICSELDGRVSELTSELAALREREALVVQARKELDDALRQKEAEFESAKAGFDFEVTKLLQEQNEIILRGRAAEDKITELNQSLDAQIEEKASIQSLYSELNSRISELANELTDLRSREQVLMQAQHDLEIAEVHNKALTDKVDTLRNRVQEGGLLAEKNLLELKQHFSAHVPPQQYQVLVRQTEELKKHIEAMNAELEARDMMVSDLTDLVRLQAAQLEHQAS
eukprot:gene10931-14672_t